MLDITQGAMQEAAQGEVDEMEEGPEGLRIERMIDHRSKGGTMSSCGPINIEKSHQTRRQNAGTVDLTLSCRLGSSSPYFSC